MLIKVRSVKMVPKCINLDRSMWKYCYSLQRLNGCCILSLLVLFWCSVHIVWHCIINSCEVGRSDLSKGCYWDRTLCIYGSRRGKYGLSYSNDNDVPSLAVDVEGQMARFVAKTLKVCSGLDVYVLMHWTWGCWCCHFRSELWQWK